MLRLFWLGLALHGVVAHVNRPHIILFVTDNLRWNDDSSQSPDQIRSPNIDALANSGLTLENHYATPICVPSRAALMTGKYPIHTDMQQDSKTSGLPLEEKLLPEHFKDLGYTTNLIGKWRLGSFMKEPSKRGNSWTGPTDMLDHTTTEKGSWDFNLKRVSGYEKADDLSEKYATDVYTDEAIKIIKNHEKSKPMFLMVANSAMQSGAPDHVVVSQRQNYAAILSELDRSVGEVLSALHESGLLNNSIVLFSTDNAGLSASNDNVASNYPFKDTKNMLWEGGLRGSAVLWSPLIEKRARVSTQRIHNADWLPTLISAAGGDLSALGIIDGIDQWETLSKNHQPTRNAMANKDDSETSTSITTDQRKLHKDIKYDGNWDTGYGPSDGEGLLDNNIMYILKDLNLLPSNNEIELTNIASIKHNTSKPLTRKPLISPCLLNTEDRNFVNEGIWLSRSQQF